MGPDVEAPPRVDACPQCSETRHLHGSMALSRPGELPDREVHLYLCGCRGVKILERTNGGPWTWREDRTGRAA